MHSTSEAPTRRATSPPASSAPPAGAPPSPTSCQPARVCAGCGGDIPEGERKDAKWCSTGCKKREENRRYYEANREAELAKKSAYHEANREAVLAKKRADRTEVRTRARQTHHAAIQRCHNPEDKNFEDSRAKGIQVHPRYRDPALNKCGKPLVDNLIADIGLPGPGDQLDRIARGNSWYAPGNVRWLSARENILNRDMTRWLTHDGRTQCLTDWLPRLDINPTTLITRLNRLGGSVERALTTPAGRQGKRRVWSWSDVFQDELLPPKS